MSELAIIEQPSALKVLEEIILTLSPAMPQDRVLDIYSRLNFYKAEMGRLKSLAEQMMIEWIQFNGDLEAGNGVRYYVGTPKVTKCRDVPATLEAILEATGGDFQKVCECLASGAIKHGAAGKVLTPEKYGELFEVKATETLEEGKVKKLVKLDENFLPPQKRFTPPAPSSDQGQPPASNLTQPPAPLSPTAQAPSEPDLSNGLTDYKSSTIAAAKESLAPKPPKSTGRPSAKPMDAGMRKTAPSLPLEQQQAAPTTSESPEGEATTQCQFCQGFTAIDGLNCHNCGQPMKSNPSETPNSSTGEPSPAEKRRIAADEFSQQDAGKLKGWLLMSRTQVGTAGMYSTAVTQSNLDAKRLGDWSEAELKGVAFRLKLAILERDAAAKK